MIRKSKFKKGDKVVFIEQHTDSSGFVVKKGKVGTVSEKYWDVWRQTWAYDIDNIPIKRGVSSLHSVAFGVTEDSLKRR